MCHRKNGRPAHIVVLCFALILTLCVGSVAYGEGFNSLIVKAKRGDVQAQFTVGVMYYYGNGVKQDYKKAREWFEKAAAMNDGRAFYALGLIYSSGDGVRQDDKKAREFYEKATAMNNAMAINNLGYMYEQGHGVKQDYKKARELYEKAASMGNALAIYNLGVMYGQGLGVKQDYKKARELYEKAAAMNNALAINNLGWLYEQGHGVKQSYSKALEYYTKGAEMGETLSMMNLGRMYENGIGINEDMSKALEFYRQASAGGNVQAKKALARLHASEKKNISVPDVSSQTQKQTGVPITDNSGAMLANNASIVRPRVAVIAFDDKSEEKNAPASAIMNMMISELHKTGAFELLEREHLDAVMNERNLLSMSDPSTAAKLGRIAGAQYIITGAITLYYYSEKGSGFLLPILGAATQAKTAYVVIDARIIDVETGKIVYASDQTGDATNKAKTSIANYNKMVGGLLGMATRNAVEKYVSAMRGLTLEI